MQTPDMQTVTDGPYLAGQMMDRPLTISSIMAYAADVHPDARITSATVEGGRHSYTYREARARIAQLAGALKAMGIGPGDRVATLAWNGYRHFELYYAVAGIGAVCHTINPRLFPDQIAWIMGHAGDRALFFDLTFAPLVAELAPRMPEGLTQVFLSDEAHRPEGAGPEVRAYETLLDAQPATFDWPEVPEEAAAALCYTSGTTGDPKGALYSHRSTVLHAMSAVLGVPQGFGAGRAILPVVPLFHVNAWGLPYACPLSGTDLVFPGPHLDGASLFDLMAETGVTNAWGVPTVWAGLIEEMSRRAAKPDALEMLLIGGSAVSTAMIERLEDFDIRTVHGWGMTEMSPIGTCTRSLAAGAERAARIDNAIPQGKRLFGLEMKIVGDDGTPQPHDGVARGELLVRGPAVVNGYFNAPEASRLAFDAEGWFRTGDVATIDAAGQLRIVDRTKDLIKSGGEWISSLELENLALAHPSVANAAAIAVPDAKWDERPLLVVVPADPGKGVDTHALLDHMRGHLAKWQVPDQVVVADALPMTATGKISKKDLRSRIADGA